MTVSVLTLVAASGVSAKPLGGVAPPSPSAAAVAAAQSGAQEAAQAVRNAQNSLKQATLAIQAQQATQQAARDAARAQINAMPNLVPNGLAAGGLQIGAGVKLPDGRVNGQLWRGANLPTEFTDGDRTKVTIGQTQQKAVLTWDTFNIGGRTDLTFDQKGNRDWVALNRVLGTEGRPSQILGSMKADGTVLVINQNGIVFGGGSQVNVGALIAATGKISNDQFLNKGIYSTQTGSSWLPSFTDAAALLGLQEGGGQIKVKAGATITTHAPSSVTAGGGFVLLMGGQVENAGSITTPRGQTQLAAGDDFVLRRGYGTDANKISTTRGNEILPIVRSAGSGSVTHSGLILGQQGDITLAGRTIAQNGVLLSTTSVNARGTIHLLNSISDKQGSVTLGAGSLTDILPELDSAETALNSQRDVLIKAPSGNNMLDGFDNLSTLTDRLDQSRIEIVTGGNAVFKSGSLTIAQGGQIAVEAGKRVFVEDGATLDTSGVRDVPLAMSTNNLKVNIQGNELRDSPQNRDSDKLKNTDVWIDIRDLVLVPAGTGGYAADRYYTPGGLLEVGGYLAKTAHKIGEWTALGGTITLSAPEVVAQQGSIFDVSGGSVTYAAGTIVTSNFLGTNGQTYNINQARGDMRFSGLGLGFVRRHQRWDNGTDKLTEVWANALGRGRETVLWGKGYTVGRDAGRLILSTPTSIFEGQILADVVRGERQINARPSNVNDGYALSQTQVALGGQLLVGAYGTLRNEGLFKSDIRFGDVANITASLSAADALPSVRAGTVWFDASHINELKLGGLDVGTKDTIKLERALTLADGAQINFNAAIVDIKADISARSGSLTVNNMFGGGVGRGNAMVLLKDGASSISLYEGATLDLRGVWINTLLNSNDSNKLAYLNGGKVSLSSTHDVVLKTGSVIDVSSGAAILPNAKTKGGRGGGVTLVADQDNSQVQSDGLLTLNGTIRGYGMSGGGTLRIESGTAIGIGGKLLANDGVLGAGEKAPADLLLMEDYQVRAGDVLPVDYSYTTNVAKPGETIGTTNKSINATLAADWTPPRPVRGNPFYVIYTNTGLVRVEADGVLPVLPAGTVVRSIAQGMFPASYVVPGDVFPNGIPITDKVVKIAAGNASPVDFTIARGSRLAAGAVVRSAIVVAPTLTVDTSLFQSGFSSYDINSHHGLVVAKGATLDITMPVNRFTDTAFATAGGADVSQALRVWTPSEWTADTVNNRLVQRGGASLTLRSTVGDAGVMTGIGPIDVREGATIRVDAGQSISLLGTSFSIDGTLTAASGTISLSRPVTGINVGIGGDAGLAWIGDRAVLDAAGRALTATNARGQTYGVVGKGGSILIGGVMDWEEKGESNALDAFVVIRPGAVLDASGASAMLDIPIVGLAARSTPLNVASDGGLIVVKSNNGLYLDGTLRAAAGGANAAGGTLALALEAANYQTLATSGDVLRHRDFVIANVQGNSSIANVASMTEAKGGLITGTARIGADRIKAGGFGNLSVLVDGALSFDGNVALAMNQSLRLYSGAFALSDSASASSQVSLSAPYVRLAGATRIGRDDHTLPAVRWADGYGSSTQRASDAVFAVAADLIDLRDRIVFGVRQDIDIKTSLYTIDRRGFALLDLTSRGDMRLLAGRVDGVSALLTPGDIRLTAAQIYPATGATASITAGYTEGDRKFLAGSVLTVKRYGDTIPDMPYSAFGSLSLAADTVNQGGVIRAPFGRVKLSIAGSDTVNLLPGSITSVSGAGLMMPYGGTVDGLVYQYDGNPVRLFGAGGMGGIDILTAHLNAEAGAVLDLSGGGELTGAGFVSGRGGSVDIRTTPLVNSNPAYSYSSKGNAVYAIVPGRGGSYAPAVQKAGDGAPLIGQQITVPDGVPGLPAGTYTLMPSSYALLPGAFRVEIGADSQINLAGARPIGNGYWSVAGTLGIANTAIRASLPNQVIITAADTVRKHSSYNEMGYNAFALADAARIGVPRAMLTVDAKTLDILMAKPAVVDGRPQLRFDGDLRIGPAAGNAGFGGTVNVRGLSEILAAGQSASSGVPGASIHADELSKLDAPRLVLNGTVTVAYGKGGRFARIDADFGDLIVRSGAHVSAAEVILAGKGRPWLGTKGAITIEEGASISTIGRGSASYDSKDGFVFIGDGVLALSNGWINLMQAPPVPGSGTDINITVGGCVTASCDRTATLVSEGTIAVSTSGAFTIANNVSYGTRNLVLGLSAINLGDDASLAAAAASGHLPSGLALNQGVLANLLAGNTATGAPALETLVFNARDAVNIFGSVTLDASKVGRLVLGTPAIFGYGATGDIATIRAGEFIWTGSASAPGAAMVGILGDSRLDIAARRVVFGYGPNSQPSSAVIDHRLAVGFTGVSINASERVTSNGEGMLSVYHKQGAFVPATGYQYSGGNLTFTTPMFTGEAGSINRITAGGDVRIVGASGAGVTKVDALGAQLELAGASVLIDTGIALPSGKLVLTAKGDIALGDSSRIDLSGRAVKMFDVTKYSWGGNLMLTSEAGNVKQAAGSMIDLSAQHNRGGTIEVSALGAGAGSVNLAGMIQGGATGQYDAGGTIVPYNAAELTVHAQTLADFAALNTRLNIGGVFGARKFRIKQGDLVVGDEVRARDVEIVLDGGDLTVNGTIDASGFQVGVIRLAAMGNLTLNGTLDAHGTGMRFDSYGKIIDAPNSAVVDLASRAGTLTLASTSKIDIRAGTEVPSGSGPGRNDGVARGQLGLNARRLGGHGGLGGVDSAGDGANDVAVDVIGTPLIRGAKTIAVNAFRIYDDAPVAGAPDVTGHKPQEITQAYLDELDRDSRAYINAALANTSLSNRLAGLGNHHLRPGVEVISRVSADNPNGDLTVAGDLDLSGYRYGPNSNRIDPALRGFGEPGVFNIRAAGNLNIRGTINDGFAPPPATTGDNGWLLDEGVVPYGGDLVLPTAVTLESGTIFKKGVTLNYDLPASFNGSLPAGTILPVRASLAGALTLSAGVVVQATIYNADGSVAYAAGTVLANTVTLSAGMQLDAGTVLSSTVAFAALTWPKGVPLPVDMTSTRALALAAGSLIPSMTHVKLAGGQRIELRASTGGRQGQNWAIAPMLGAGATSWSMQLTAGADLGSADVRARNSQRKGDIVLADSHFASRSASGGSFLNLNAAGAAAIIAALGFDYPDLTVNDLLGKSEAEVAAILGGTWAEVVAYYPLPANFWNPALGNIELGLTMQGIDVIVSINGLPFGVADKSELLNLTRREVASLYGDPNYTWADFGVAPNFADYGQGNLDTISLPPSTTYASPSFSVIRTGTGNLSLAAAGNIRMDSLYGVYTAGTATSVDPAYNRPRGLLPDGTLLGPLTADYAAATAVYQAWYPGQGGNVEIAAGGNLVGDIYGQSWRQTPSSVITGNWLWRQGTGSTAVDTKLPTSWWINFGTYVANTFSDPRNAALLPDIVGFTGIGALGGGNVAIRVGGDAGAITLRGSQAGASQGEERSQGLVIAVGSTGRVGADGSLALTGGGDIDMRIGGAINPNLALTSYTEKHALPGALINLRGALHVAAESIGGIKLIYQSGNGLSNAFDPRGFDPFKATSSDARSGITLVPGDSAVYLETRGDLVLGGAGDPGRSQSPNRSAISASGVNDTGQTWFTLWTDHTAINLLSAGGNLTPTTSSSEKPDLNSDHNVADVSFTYPSIFRAAALGGSIYYGIDALSYMRGLPDYVPAFVTLAPSAHGSLEMLARDSIYGGQYSFSLSGSGVALPTPFNPAFMGDGLDTLGRTKITNGSPSGVVDIVGNSVPLSLFFFGPNTAAFDIGRAPDAGPIRFYAREGDVVGLSTGETLTLSGGLSKWYNAAAPIVVRAGRDIIGAGAKSRSNLIMHNDPKDVSIISAGRDIIFANFDIAGPGTLEISAGRNLYQADMGAITSIEPIATGDTRPGAGIVMQAGAGSNGPDYAKLAALYLDPANLADSKVPLADQKGKVAKTYEKELADWLKERYGFVGTIEEARATFDTLAPEQQRIFLRQVYFAELREGGREYNNRDSVRHGSYLRGRHAIAALFPDADADGKAIVRTGDITLFGGSGVRTLFGGGIQMLSPGGHTIIGVEGQVPPASAGLITQGSGGIEMYAKGSILLGLSRIMTTFGGDIAAWSAEGDINAGRGSKTTVLYTPPKRSYDNYGNVTLSPQVPSSGAGIATLNPVPGIPSGDIDLVAPLGTIDAGEAGIRVSGNVNLAALHIVNAANIQVQGSSSGIPQVQAPNIGGLTQASNAAGAAAQQAKTPTHDSGTAQPSIIIVEVLGFGGSDGSEVKRGDEEERRRRSDNNQGQNPMSSVQVIGAGDLSSEQRQKLTVTERRNFDEP